MQFIVYAEVEFDGAFLRKDVSIISADSGQMVKDRIRKDCFSLISRELSGKSVEVQIEIFIKELDLFCFSMNVDQFYAGPNFDDPMWSDPSVLRLSEYVHSDRIEEVR